MRELPQIKSPTEPKRFYTLKQALYLAGVTIHELQDWTRLKQRGYFKPTHPARGRGSRQEFSFRDLFVLRMIRLLKLTNMRQHLITDIIGLINKDETQAALAKNPAFNFLEESSDLTQYQDKIRYDLHGGVTQDSDPIYLMIVEFVNQNGNWNAHSIARTTVPPKFIEHIPENIKCNHENLDPFLNPVLFKFEISLTHINVIINYLLHQKQDSRT